MKKLYFAIIILILSGCAGEKNTMGKLEPVPVESKMKFEKICDLGETINFLGSRVSSIEFIDNEHFYIVTNEPSRAYLYNTKGEQLKEINRVGKGNGEYIQIGSFKVKDDKQYLWCNMSMQMHIYDKDTKIINSFSLKNNCHDFLINNDVIIFPNSYHPEGHLLSIYDTNGNLLKDLDTQTKANYMMSSFAFFPDMFIKDNILYYTHADELGVYELNLNDYSMKINPIEDDDFIINREITDKQTQSRTFSKRDYTATNSGVLGLFNYKDDFVLAALLGKILIENDEIKDNSKRYLAYYILDKDKKLKERIVFRNSEHGKYVSEMVSYNGQLYAISLEQAGTDTEKYALYKINFI